MNKKNVLEKFKSNFLEKFNEKVFFDIETNLLEKLKYDFSYENNYQKSKSFYQSKRFVLLGATVFLCFFLFLSFKFDIFKDKYNDYNHEIISEEDIIEEPVLAIDGLSGDKFYIYCGYQEIDGRIEIELMYDFVYISNQKYVLEIENILKEDYRKIQFNESNKDLLHCLINYENKDILRISLKYDSVIQAYTKEIVIDNEKYYNTILEKNLFITNNNISNN